MIFEISYRRLNNKEVLQQQPTSLQVLSPEQQRILITATPVRKVAVLSLVKNENIITKIGLCFLKFYITE
jgi:hypothetical protein